MTMYDGDSIDKLANAFYHQSLALMDEGAIPRASQTAAPVVTAGSFPPGLALALPFTSHPDSPIEPESLAALETVASPKPVLFYEPGLDASRAYYFLNTAVSSKIAAPDYGNLPAHPSAPAGVRAFPIQTICKDFPILQQQVNGKPLIWFDNAATTQKPHQVIDALSRFYRESNSNVHRGAHTMAAKATGAYEKAREKIQQLIGAAAAEEIIFVRGTTEAINLVAQTHGRMNLGKGDEILVSTMEHHSNIVPWQLIAAATGAVIHSIPITTRGEIVLSEYEKLLSRRTRIVAITQVSNVLGTINPVRSMIEMAHVYGACVVVDGAQSVPHFKVDVRALDADFYTFSGHKMYGPTGIGALYGKKALLEEMPPWQGGGNMINTVTFAGTTYNTLPHKFEAGTGNIAAAVGLGEAADYLQKIGLAHIERYEGEITAHAMNRLGQIPGVRLIGTAPRKTSVVSFLAQGITPEELASRLDQEGIAVRAGHHCAQPLMQHFGLPGTLRVSLGLYNTKEEIDILAAVLAKIIRKHV